MVDIKTNVVGLWVSATPLNWAKREQMHRQWTLHNVCLERVVRLNAYLYTVEKTDAATTKTDSLRKSEH